MRTPCCWICTLWMLSWVLRASGSPLHSSLHIYAQNERDLLVERLKRETETMSEIMPLDIQMDSQPFEPIDMCDRTNLANTLERMCLLEEMNCFTSLKDMAIPQIIIKRTNSLRMALEKMLLSQGGTIPPKVQACECSLHNDDVWNNLREKSRRLQSWIKMLDSFRLECV